MNNKQPVIRINTPTEDDILKRLERLEEVVQVSGAMLLFLVDDGKYLHWLVAAPRFEDVMMLLPQQGNIEFLGRAHEMYQKTTIIRAWDMTPGPGYVSPYT
jgi:hypothetical protein